MLDFRVRCWPCKKVTLESTWQREGWIAIRFESKWGLGAYMVCGKICAARMFARAISEIGS